MNFTKGICKTFSSGNINDEQMRANNYILISFLYLSIVYNGIEIHLH
jgi:hypothetical protein